MNSVASIVIDVMHLCSVEMPYVTIRQSREGGNPVPRLRTAHQWPHCLAVSDVGVRAVPKLAQYAYWIPAFAGMTSLQDVTLSPMAIRLH